MPRFAGLDLAAGRGVTALAVLTVEEDSSLRYEAGESVHLTTDDAILDALGRVTPRVLAIDAPLSLPRIVLSALLTQPTSESAEAQSTSSPYTRAAERDPVWTTLGVRPFPVSFLGGLTFRALTLCARIRASLPELPVIETFPTATFRMLSLTTVSRAGETRPRKAAPAARQALQQRLSGVIRGVPSTDVRLLDADSLDALGAALAAVAYALAEYTAIGDATEGQIILPRPALAQSVASSDSL